MAVITRYITHSRKKANSTHEKEIEAAQGGERGEGLAYHTKAQPD